MENNIKISLTIELEGSTLIKGEPEVKHNTITLKDLYPERKFKGTEGKKVIRRVTYKTYSLIAKPAFQKINMTKEAYDYMVSAECPSFADPKVWGRMSRDERLKAHFQRTCEHLGGKSFSYKILDD